MPKKTPNGHKGKRSDRRLPLHPTAKFALGRWLVELRQNGAFLVEAIFCS